MIHCIIAIKRHTTSPLSPLRFLALAICWRHDAIPAIVIVNAIIAAWSIGAVLGPGVGGMLAEPAVSYPGIFSEDGVFGRCVCWYQVLLVSRPTCWKGQWQVLRRIIPACMYSEHTSYSWVRTWPDLLLSFWLKEICPTWFCLSR